MFGRRKTTGTVREGALYERVLPTNVVERAEVVWIGTGPSGITHVRYNMSYLRPDGSDPQGSRILSMSSFVERYTESASST